MYTLGIITSSDTGYRGEREDKSGQVIREMAEASGFIVEDYVIVPDEKDALKEQFIKMSDELKLNLILSTGGTGFSPRDITPEATKEIIEREAPGIVEAIRMYSISITKRAMLSRAVSGIRGKTLIVNLPGSPKACEEALEYVLNDLKHGIDILNEKAKNCARK
ncbi:MAG: MogA/MoaB family molybdenum cofactor biosynthesis protein [Sarcina sp.]